MFGVPSNQENLAKGPLVTSLLKHAYSSPVEMPVLCVWF